MIEKAWLTASLAIVLLAPANAAAYLDPGAGSMLLQALMALIGATVATLGLYWRAVKHFILRLFNRKGDPTSQGGS
jgi:hypothetical protein